MARLIVEEGGKRRAFKVGDGVLTIGSGAEARLKLASTAVAEIHCDLKVTGEEFLLRPRPGVVPPSVGGVEAGGDIAVPYGVPIELGGARMWLEEESTAPGTGLAGDDAGPSADDARQTQKEAETRKAIRRQAAMQAATSRGDRSVVQRSRPRVERGLPGYAIVLLILGGVAVVGLVFGFLWQGALEEGASPAQAKIDAAEEHFTNARYDAVVDKLNEIPAGRDISPEEQSQIDDLRARVREKQSVREVDLWNMRGTQYLDTKIGKYEELYLQGNPDTPKIRVFLKRCRWFKERWPQHPRLDWVSRQESRFSGLVDLSMPPTFADVEWEVKSLTKTSPRDYEEAFRILDAYMARGDADDPAAAVALHDTMIAERLEYHEDRQQQARYEYEKGNNGKAVWWLVHGIIWIGDRDLADDTAGYLLNIPLLHEHLLGYKNKYPDKFEELIKHPDVRAYADEHALID